MSYTISDVISAMNEGLISREEATEYAKNVFNFRWPGAIVPDPNAPEIPF